MYNVVYRQTMLSLRCVIPFSCYTRTLSGNGRVFTVVCHY